MADATRDEIWGDRAESVVNAIKDKGAMTVGMLNAFAQRKGWSSDVLKGAVEHAVETGAIERYQGFAGPAYRLPGAGKPAAEADEPSPAVDARSIEGNSIWIGTKVAANMLGVSSPRVCQLADQIQHRPVEGRRNAREWLRADVLKLRVVRGVGLTATEEQDESGDETGETTKATPAAQRSEAAPTGAPLTQTELGRRVRALIEATDAEILTHEEAWSKLRGWVA